MNSDENHTSRKPKWCKVIKHPGIKYVIKAVINGLIMLFTVSLIHFLVSKSCNTGGKLWNTLAINCWIWRVGTGKKRILYWKVAQFTWKDTKKITVYCEH